MKKLMLSVGMCVLFFSGCTLHHPDNSATMHAAIPLKRTILIQGSDKSREGGTATVEEVNGRVRISITVGENSATAVHPAVVTTGNCPNTGATKYTLNNVVNGKSETDLPDDMKTLIGLGWTEIIIYQSSKDANLKIGCGNINST